MRRNTQASSSTLLTFMASVVVLGLLQSAPSPLSAEQAAKRESVLASNLGSKIDVIGRLGVPLGRLITVEGRVAPGDVFSFKGFTDCPVLFVEKLDGRALPPNTWIRLRPYGPSEKALAKAGLRCTLRGFETGGFLGSPPDAMKAYGIMFQDVGWYFNTEFKYVKVIELKKDESKQPYPNVPDGR